MPNIPQIPSVGPDYQTLANLYPNNLVVPGGNPAGNVGTAGTAMYLGQQQAQRQQMLQKATQMAEMEAQLKAQQAGEYQAGAPGRMADIQTGNALSQGRLGSLPDLLEAQKRTAQAGAGEAGAKAVQANFDKYAPYADQWAEATSKSERDDIRQQMKDDGVISGSKLDQLTDTQLDTLMKRVRGARINTPAQIGKEKVEKLKTNAAIERANIAAKARVDVQKRADELRRELANLKLTSYEKLHPNEFIFHKLYDEANGDPIKQAEASEWFQRTQLARDIARAGNAPQQYDVDPNAGTVTPRPPKAPQPTRPPLANKTTASQADIQKYHHFIQQAGGDQKKIDFINSQWQAKFGELPK